MAKDANNKIEDNMARTPAPKGLLSKLEFSDIKRSAGATTQDPVERARLKLIDGVREQIKHIQAEIKGEEYAPVKVKFTEAPDGKRIREEVPKRKLLWYWNADGTYYTECRYGSSPLDFGQGTAIRAGKTLASVIEVLDLVIQATEAGELDEELMRVAARRGRKPLPTSPKDRLQARAARR